VSPLSDLQARVRRAVVHGEMAALEPALRGGHAPAKRLAIHHRHYTTSLVTAIVDRFPATVWLVGGPLVSEAAALFVREYPPARPCIAEYGEHFPRFLSAQPTTRDVPYLGQFAELEWHLGRLSLAVDRAPLSNLSAVDSRHIAGVRLELQSGVHYAHFNWPVDALISLYLTDCQPDTYTLDVGEVWVELRGRRGELQMQRLTQATCAFRAAIAGGSPLGDAAVAALDVEAEFDVSQALVTLLSEGLVAAIDVAPDREEA
jgi:hypothetical protein